MSGERPLSIACASGERGCLVGEDCFEGKTEEGEEEEEEEEEKGAPSVSSFMRSQVMKGQAATLTPCENFPLFCCYIHIVILIFIL